MPFLTQIMGLTTLSRISSAVSVRDVARRLKAFLCKKRCVLYKTMNSLFVISVCYIANSAARLLSEYLSTEKLKSFWWMLINEVD